jgi:hypothetical protein
LAGATLVMSGTKGKSKETPKKARKTAKNSPKTKAKASPARGKPPESPRKKPVPPDVTFRPTADQRNLVTLGVATGMTEKEICALIKNSQTDKPISITTLKKHFPDEMENGEARVTAKVVSNLVTIASSPTHKSAVTAAIFWLKTRRRWREPEPEFVERRRLDAAKETTSPDGTVERIAFTLVLEEPKPPVIDATATEVA